MDRLDKISISVIIILAIASFVLAGGYKSEAGPNRNAAKKKASANYALANGEIENKVKLARNFMESNNIEKAELLVKEMIQKYPYEGEPHMVMADIFLRKQEFVMAMPEYKEAIDINPDYLDKKTPLFQGKKIKTAVREALAEVEKRLDADPGDKEMKDQRKTIYYLERRIAGSCG